MKSNINLLKNKAFIYYLEKIILHFIQVKLKILNQERQIGNVNMGKILNFYIIDEVNIEEWKQWECYWRI